MSGAAALGKGVLVRGLWGGSKTKFSIARRRTIVEHGNPDGTLVLLMKGLEHVKVINPGWDDITST